MNFDVLIHYYIFTINNTKLSKVKRESAKYENVKIRLQFNDFNDAVDFYEQSLHIHNLNSLE